MYLLFLICFLTLSYILLVWWLPRVLCSGKMHFSLRACVVIFVASLISMTLAVAIMDPFWSNRVLHALGGGVMMALVVALSLRDASIRLGFLQYALLSFLIVTTAGVGNELMESFLQWTTSIPFTDSINDTWLDLWSNTVGAVVWIGAFVKVALPK